MSVPMVPVPDAPDTGLPYLQWVIYRDSDGQLISQVRGQQPSLDATIATAGPGYSVSVLPEGTRFETVGRYGFIDVDDPAKPLCYDADKLKADGVTLADVLAGTIGGGAGHGGAVWDAWPIKKPTKAT